MSSLPLPIRVKLRWSMLLAGLVYSACCYHPSIAQDVPAIIPAAPPAPGFVGKCSSCIGSLGGMLSGCKQSCCNSPLGTLINGAFEPLKFATGGVIPTPCPDPPNKPGGGPNGGAPGPQQAAEAIKQDQAQAKARAEAVRYLATVPCHYYPEAEVALITALRTDRSECVRWEAAHALAQGCCCTKRTIEALKITASGSQKDGNPSEISIRVRVEAMNALQHCLAMCSDSLEAPQRPEVPAAEPETIPTPLPPPRRPEAPTADNAPAADTTSVQPADYYVAVEKRPADELLAEARQLVDSFVPAEQQREDHRRGKSLYELWQSSDPVLASRVVMPPITSLPEAAQNATNIDELQSPTLAQPDLPPPAPGWGEAITRIPSVSVLKSNTTRTLGPPQFAPNLANRPSQNAPYATPSAPSGSQLTDGMAGQQPTVSIHNRTLEPSQQWVYPPYHEPIRAALRPDWLEPQPPDQSDPMWR